jgi:hypothetical protein
MKQLQETPTSWPEWWRSFESQGTIFFFFKIWGLWVSKDEEFNVDFKNINLTFVTTHKKSYSRNTNFFYTQGAMCSVEILFFLE